MTGFARLNFVTIGVTDLARATAFYEAIGWVRSNGSQSEIAFMKSSTGAGTNVILWSYDELAHDANLEAAPTEKRHAAFGGQALAVNVPTESDVTAALATVEAAGGRILKPATHADWGGVSGYFADPDGYPWEVAYNPHFTLDDDGVVHLP